MIGADQSTHLHKALGQIFSKLLSVLAMHLWMTLLRRRQKIPLNGAMSFHGHETGSSCAFRSAFNDPSVKKL